MLLTINTCENVWSNFSSNLRVVALNLLEWTQFAWPNLSIYFNFLCAVLRCEVINRTRFLMRPPVIIPWSALNYVSLWIDQVQGSHTQTTINIASKQYAISNRRVLLIFVSLFIEGIWCWKLNSYKFYYNLYYKNHPKREKHFFSGSCLVSWIQNTWYSSYFVNLSSTCEISQNCAWPIIINYSLTLAAGIMDTQLLIYFASACKINYNIFSLLFCYIF